MNGYRCRGSQSKVPYRRYRADLTPAKMGQWRRVTRFAVTRFRYVIELEGESDSRFAWGSDKFTVLYYECYEQTKLRVPLESTAKWPPSELMQRCYSAYMRSTNLNHKSYNRALQSELSRLGSLIAGTAID